MRSAHIFLQYRIALGFVQKCLKFFTDNMSDILAANGIFIPGNHKVIVRTMGMCVFTLIEYAKHV